ncbi:MAG: hypothetical protein II776_08145, partial [Clostridia bacterium]|nr:hypothetical protein [Clostridia bacterium]
MTEGKKTVAAVRLLTAAKATDRAFDYLCPPGGAPLRGQVVRVPFGKGDRDRFGVVTDVRETTPDRALKTISEIFPPEIGLNEELFALCTFLQEQIFCTFGDAARTILPSPVYKKAARQIRLARLGDGVDPEKALDGFTGKSREVYRA